MPSALLAQGVALPGPPQQPYYGQGAYPYPYMAVSYTHLTLPTKA